MLKLSECKVVKKEVGDTDVLVELCINHGDSDMEAVIKIYQNGG